VLGFLVQFLGYLEWLGPNHKYFLENEGPTVNFPIARGPWQNLHVAQGPKCKMATNYEFLKIIFQWKIRWIRSTARGPGDVARVHGGPKQRGEDGTAAPCWHAVRGW
jgi:hypothetical protein